MNDLDPIGIIGIKGRNGSDPTLMIPGEQCLEAMNVDWFRSSLGRKRGGASNLSLAVGAATAFSTGVVALGRHVPGDDQGAAEFWALDGARNFHRLAGSVTWVSPTVLDACTATPQEAAFVSFNGKYFIAYKSAQNRLHVWDGATLRRVGLDMPPTPAAPAEAGGAVTDTRKYRIAWTFQVSDVTVKRSNLSAATGVVTLSAEQATITRGTPPGEGETHWELYGSSSPYADYRLIATTAIGTTTAVDNAALPSTVAQAEGANTPPPSARYIVADDARIIMGGAYETVAGNAMVPKNNRVWWTSVLGATDIGDDERISNTGTINSYADIEEAITGISPPMYGGSTNSTSLDAGSFYVFSFRGQWKFIQTGSATAPYIKFKVASGRGCIHHKSIVVAKNVNGSPATYWASEDGPMRATQEGQEFIGQDVVDLWGTINLDATIPCHTVAVSYLQQVWFYIATGSSLYPDTKIVFDTRLGRVTETSGVRMGWSVHSGESAKAYCSHNFSDTVAASMGRKLKPYIGYREGTAIWKCDTTDASDVGNLFQAYIDTRSYTPWGLGKLGGVSDVITCVARAQQGVTLRLTIYRNEGAEEAPFDADLTDISESAAADKVFSRFENSRLADSYSFRCRIGDSQPTENTWNLDALIVPVYGGGN